jgi:hypothetical protein
VATVTGPVTAGGNASAAIAGLQDGAYTLTLQVVGGYFTSPISQPIPITVGVPTAVTLGGLSASGSVDAGWLPWLAALLIAPALMLAAWRRRQVDQRRPR